MLSMISLKGGLNFQSRDSYGLIRFSVFLKQCHVSMTTIDCLAVLDDERENIKKYKKNVA